MKLRIIYNHWLFKTIHRGYGGIVLYPFVLFKRSKEEVSDRLFRHELQHVYQVQETGWLKYYLTYLFYNLKYGYKNNPYEVEARAQEYNEYTEAERKLKDS